MLLLKHRLLRPSLLMHVGETWMVVVHMFWGTEGGACCAVSSDYVVCVVMRAVCLASWC